MYEPIIETQIQELPVEKQKELCPMIAGHILRQDWRKHLEEARLQLPPQPEGSPPLPLAEMLLVTSSSQVVEALARVRSLVAQKKIRSAMEEAFYALQYAPGYCRCTCKSANCWRSTANRRRQSRIPSGGISLQPAQ